MHFPAIDSYFQKQQEPARSTLIWLREHLKKQHAELEERWRYGMPFLDLDGRMFCYLWCASATGTPYIGFVDGAIIAGRSPSKIEFARARSCHCREIINRAGGCCVERVTRRTVRNR